MRFKLFMVVNIETTVFFCEMLCAETDGYQHWTEI